jgi:hypothetical protein
VRIRSVGLGLCVAGVLAGCGGGSSLSTGAAEAGRAINLRPGDVPGLVAGPAPRHPERTVGPFGRSIERCDGGVAGPRGIAGLASPWFTHMKTRGSQHGSGIVPLESLHSPPRFELVHSIVYVFASEAAALRELRAIRSAGARRCIARRMAGDKFISRVNGKPATETPAYRHIRVVARPPWLGPHSYGLRATGDSRFGPGPARPSYADSLGFVIGRVLVVLFATGESRPLPATTQQHLLSLLYYRARAHRL